MIFILITFYYIYNYIKFYKYLWLGWVQINILELQGIAHLAGGTPQEADVTCFTLSLPSPCVHSLVGK
jgi:hypothetical protein